MKRFLSQIPCLTMVFVLFILCSCKKDDFKEEENFIKVYSDVDGNKKFYPLALQATSDGGSIILSAVNGWNIYLMKIDALGEVVWKKEVEEPYVSATPNLISFQGKFFIVCMDKVGLYANVLEVNEGSGAVSLVKKLNGILYPTFAFHDGQNLFIQNYNRTTNETGVHKLNALMDAVELDGYVEVMTSVLTEMVNHTTFIGKRFPFTLSANPERTGLVMNCFYNYSFSTVFLDANLEMTGVYNGAAYTGGLNGILPLGANRFSVAKFVNENQYFNASVTLDPSSINITENINAVGYSEVDNTKPVVIKELNVDGTSSICVVSTTRTNQLLVQIFDKASGTLLGTKYLGKNTPLMIGDVIGTADGGALFLVQMKVMGGTTRLASIKLSHQQLQNLIGKGE